MEMDEAKLEAFRVQAARSMSKNLQAGRRGLK
jgi:hypothetical protein